jgi:dihydroorotase
MKPTEIRSFRPLFTTFLLLVCITSVAQDFDLLIKNGHVIDPGNNINGKMDVAISQGKIVDIAREIESGSAKKTIDASGLYVCPGLIDIHTHVFVGSNPNTFADGINSLSPDDFTFKAGVTTVVDAGTSGWRNFPKFKSQVIDQSKTRILVFLNIVGTGMTGTKQQEDLDDMDPKKTADFIREHHNTIVGVKVGHYEGKAWTPFDNALKACSLADVPLFVECHLPQYTLQDQLQRMRPGDIITHSYEKVSERIPIVDEDGHVREFVTAAKERGIYFDLGHGGAGFWFSQVIPALKQGIVPNSFGTDLHRFSMNAGMKDMLNVMSKFLALGMPLDEVILRATWAPAQSIKRKDLGQIGNGAVADVSVLSLRSGKFGYVDAGGNRIDGNQKLEAELTIREGKIVWDLNGISAVPIDSRN